MFANYMYKEILCQMKCSSRHRVLINISSQNEQRKISVALSQDGGGGLGKSAGRYYGLGRERAVAARGGRESR